MKRLFLIVLFALSSISTQCIDASKNLDAKNNNKNYSLVANAGTIAGILLGLGELKFLNKRSKKVCETLGYMLMVYKIANKLPLHHRNYRARNDFSAVEGLYSLSAAAFITASIAKCIKELRKTNPVPAE